MSTPDESAIEMVRTEPPCLNCGAPMHGDFCHQCGQPKKGMIRHLPGLIADFFDSVFNLDTRTVRTLGPLLVKPGFLSTEYFVGRRTRYVTPLRLYLFMSVIAFLAVAMVSQPRDEGGNLGVTIHGEATLEQRIARIDAEEKKQLDRLEKNRATLPDAVFEMQRAQVADRAEAEREEEREEERNPTEVTPEKPNPYGVTVFSGKPWHPRDNPVHVAYVPDAVNTWLNDKVAMLLVNAVETRKHPAKFIAALFSVAPQSLLMILPLFALLLKLFYLFKRRLYMEHLIVALHSHSFLCTAILVLVLLNRIAVWASTWPLVPGLMSLLVVVTSLWIPMYLLIAQKRIYGQGWPMTILKYVAIGLCYTMLLGFGIMINLVWALASL
ncbi:MAG TPA: DUF3667 domain-containing protein [Patescibacteria group bacterium]|nr:DUF3667 domain-containing protein [Patescibacteria group bacterium]